MGAKTAILWTDATHNFWIGCTEVTDACDNCYARTLAERYGWAVWGNGEPRYLTSLANRRKPLAWDKTALTELGRKRRVFSFSLADVFDTEVPEEWRTDFFQLVHQTQNTYWQFLTKRASVPRRYAGQYDADKVWLGTSLGSDKDMHMAYEIVKAPALLHWISYEPAIGPLNVYDLPEQIKWLVIGGESGHGARPFNIEWALSAVEACKDLGVSVFVKQLGLHPKLNGVPYPVSDSHGKILSEWPEALRVQEFPL